MYTKKEEKFLLDIARKAIADFLEQKEFLEIDGSRVSENLKKERAVFVTLTIDGELRGCIGHLETIQPLYKDVIENAVSAAFKDHRFYPLTSEELERVKIEISVLTPAEKITYSNSEELLEKIHLKGVIIKKGFAGATYLPQVWEQLPGKEKFISSLCLKAGLPGDEWKTGSLDVQVYSCLHFEENLEN